MAPLFPARPGTRPLGNLWTALRDEELGATMADYAVLLTLVTVGLVAAIGAMSTQISAVVTTVASALGVIQN